LEGQVFKEFSGRDIMPLYIVDLIKQVRHLFDYLVIATPYHDIASKEWSQMEFHWVRNVDPFLLGFVKQVPELVFFLGRWSGRALFPIELRCYRVNRRGYGPEELSLETWVLARV
jgi:hypothetical protein